jgi:hypothetical protein
MAELALLYEKSYKSHISNERHHVHGQFANNFTFRMRKDITSSMLLAIHEIAVITCNSSGKGSRY